MTIPFEIIKKLSQEFVYSISEKVELNLPHYQGNIPLRKRQHEAVELMLSNCPIVMIGGTPASGKTQVAIAALMTAIQHQKSILIIAPCHSTFERYTQSKELPIQAQIINQEQNYNSIIQKWLMDKFKKVSITIAPPNYLYDPIFESNIIQDYRQYWIEIINSGDTILKKEIKQKFPQITLSRQFLLKEKLKKSGKLLEHREHLKQNYQNLSPNAMQELGEVVSKIMTIPICCSIDQLDSLQEKKFDFVIVEDSQRLNAQAFKSVAKLSYKLILMGELTPEKNLFKHLFNNLSPAYRLQLTENHRVSVDLAHYIFKEFYKLNYFPYTPTDNPPRDISVPKLTWYDVRRRDKIFSKVNDFINQKSCQNLDYGLLVFSLEWMEILRTLMTSVEYSDIKLKKIYSVENWTGRECQNIVIFCDQEDICQPTLEQIRLALTRSFNTITFFGNKDYYEKSDFKSLFDYKRLNTIRDIDWVEDEHS